MRRKRSRNKIFALVNMVGHCGRSKSQLSQQYFDALVDVDDLHKKDTVEFSYAVRGTIEIEKCGAKLIAMTLQCCSMQGHLYRHFPQIYFTSIHMFAVVSVISSASTGGPLLLDKVIKNISLQSSFLTVTESFCGMST